MKGLPLLLTAAAWAVAVPAQAQDACGGVTSTSDLVVWLVQGDSVAAESVVVQLQDTLSLEARPTEFQDRWRTTLPRPIPPDSIVLRGIEGLSYRQARPATLTTLDNECVTEILALYDVSVRVSVSVTSGVPAPEDPAIRLAGLTALATALATTNRMDETTDAAIAANRYRLNPDSVPDPQDPRLADPTYELGGVFLFLGDAPAAEAVYRDAERGRAAQGYDAWTRERYGLAESDTTDLTTLMTTAQVLSYLGLARAIEAQGRHDEAEPWRRRAETLLTRTDLVIDTVPALQIERFQDPWGRRVIELNGSVGILNDEPEYAIGDVDIIRRDAIGTIRVGYVTDFRMFVEAHAANSLIRVKVTSDEPGLQRNLNAWFFGGDVGFTFLDNDDADRKFQMFAAVGGEIVQFNPDGLPRETDFGWIYGIGARYLLTPHVAIRSDLRMHHVEDALQETLSTLAGLAPQDLQLLELSVGVSWMAWPGYPYREADRQRREAADEAARIGR